MPVGRPTDYTPELGSEICLRLASGESLRSICRDAGMPDKGTVLKWLFLEKFPEFNDQYARARRVQAELYAEEVIGIADDGTNDYMEKLDDEGNPNGKQVNGEHIQRSRLRVDTRKWVACKLLPKVYGDKVEATHKGDAENPIKIDSTLSPSDAYLKMIGKL